MKTWHAYLGLVIALAGVLLASACNAQDGRMQPFPALCAESAYVEQQLAGVGEHVVTTGLSKGNSVMQVWANEHTHTWSLVIRLSSGRSCLLATGEAYEPDQPT